MPGEIVDVFEDGGYRRVLGTGGRHVLVSVRPRGDAPRTVLEVHGDALRAGEAATLIRTIRRIFNLDLDLEGFYRFVEDDDLLAPIARQLHGYRPPRFASLFESILCTILGQQVNVRFALDVKRRVVCALGASVTRSRRRYFAFPTPAAVYAASPATLRALRVSRQKTRYILGVAKLFLDGALDEPKLMSLDDEAAVRTLSEITGIGRWSAEYILVRGLGRASVVPAAGTGIRAAFAHFFNRALATEEDVRRLSARWGVYKGLAAFYLRFAYYRK